MEYAWPGNVRELQNILQFALINSTDATIEKHHLPSNLIHHHDHVMPVRKRQPLDPAQVNDALEQAHGNKQRAAQILGVSRSTLYRFFQRQREAPSL
jgi:transcriptional regulator of acetoin/glycerol metabolism